MALTVQEQMIIEQRVTNDAKSIGAAYLLWLFLGGAGGHGFYLGRSGSGAAMLILLVVGLITSVIGVGAILLIVVGLRALIDAVLLPGMVSKQKDNVRQRLTIQALAVGGASR